METGSSLNLMKYSKVSYVSIALKLTSSLAAERRHQHALVGQERML